jgi:signal peptidase I
MTKARILHVAREVLLTSAAILGAVCLVMVVAGFAFGVRPLMFRSGSMAPAIDTGDLSISRTVDAADLHRGDVVSVVAADGQRVTHRLVTNTRVGGTHQLTLRGDANQVVDQQVYDVTSAQKVMFTLPRLGYAVDWLSRAPGVYLVALYVGLLLMLIGRRSPTPGSDDGAAGPAEPVEAQPVRTHRGDEPARRRPLAALVTAAALGLVLVGVAGWTLPTWAAWNDSVAVSGSSFAAGAGGTLPNPGSLTCVHHTVSQTYGFSWSASSGATSYTLSYYIGNAGSQTPHTGLTATTFTTGDDLKINGGHDWRVQAESGWGSSAAVTSTTCSNQSD